MKLSILTLLVTAALALSACGGKTEKKEAEKTPPAPSLTVNVPAVNNPVTAPPTNQTVSNANASNAVQKKDDRDDKSGSKSVGNSNSKTRGDADDRGKKDSDGDADDN